MRLKTAFLTHPGGRKENQDFCAALKRDGYGCYLVADGLGGHRGGALASKTAGESVLEAFITSPGASQKQLQAYLEHARRALVLRAQTSERVMTLKTTLVVLLTDFRDAVWAHIGDSRLYHFRSNRLLFQTLDHSVPQLLAAGGEITIEEIRFHEDRNRLTGAFDGGEANRITYSAASVRLEQDDAFLLCSDGFWEYVFEPEMEEDLAAAKSPEDWLSLMESRLAGRAVNNNDNYTALAVMAR